MEKKGGGNHCSSREDGAAAEGAGGLFYGVGHMPSRVTLCKTQCQIRTPEELEQEWSTQYVTNGN